MKVVKYCVALILLFTPSFAYPILLLQCAKNVGRGNICVGILFGAAVIGVTLLYYQLMDWLAKDRMY